MLRLFTAGGMIIDNVVSPTGAVHRETLGGNAVYSAAGARLWLDAVGIVALIPRNYPLQWVELLRDVGINTEGISSCPEYVGCSEWFFYRDDGSRADRLYAEPGTFEGFGLSGDHLDAAQVTAFEAFLRARSVNGLDFSAFRRLHPVRTADVPESYREVQGVHLAPNDPVAQRTMAQDLRQKGRFITLDPGFHAAALPGTALHECLPLLDAVLPSEKELRLMVPGVPHSEGLAQLRRAGASVAVVKLAAAGALLDYGKHAGPVLIPVIPVNAIDPTGAGDAFCGGYLAGLLATADPVCAALCGTVSASFAVESYGPFCLFNAQHDEVLHRWCELAQRCRLQHSDRLLSQLAGLRRH